MGLSNDELNANIILYDSVYWLFPQPHPFVSFGYHHNEMRTPGENLTVFCQALPSSQIPFAGRLFLWGTQLIASSFMWVLQAIKQLQENNRIFTKHCKLVV